MNKRFLSKIYRIILILIVLCSCKKEDEVQIEKPAIDEPAVSELPLTCESFAKLQPVIGEFNENGVSVSITLGSQIPLDSVSTFGFTYKIVGDWETEKITIEKNNPSSIKLEVILADTLICGLEYEISGFISFGDSICTSSTKIFSPQRSYPSSPWCAGILKTGTGFDRSFGTSINGKPFVIFQSNSFYQIDNNLKIIPRKPFPLAGHTGVEYAIFSIGKFGYFKSSESRNLYRYSSEEDSWTNLGNTNLTTNFHFGGQLNGKGYIFNSIESYQYDSLNNTFVKLSSYEQPMFINKFQTNSSIYVIDENYQILEFDESKGTWVYLTTYPGNKSDDIVSFVQNNKAYIGLSHRFYSPGRITYYDIYELDLETKKWKELIPFPYKFMDSYGISSVSAPDLSYIIYRQSTSNFRLFAWRFDSSKILYK